MPHARAQDGASIAYRVVGKGPREVILLHGWMTTGAVFDDLIEVLDLDGLRLLVPDLRGTGGSAGAPGRYDLAQHAADVLAVAAAASAGPLVLVGHSMGGQIAQWIAAAAPAQVAGLVLLCPVPAAGLSLPEPARELFWNSAGNREQQRTILQMACRELSQAALERLLDLAASIPAPCLQEGLQAWSRGGFADRLAAIRAPTLVVATDDPFLPPFLLQTAVAAPIAGARLAVLPGPGHYPQVERPRETAALLQAFLAGLGAR